ncbi:MAG: exo-alpha-sialidase [Phycisphaeraceae bacterium]|nr:exo-alpha-sialidase [Phycisphaeraceae bacterium]
MTRWHLASLATAALTVALLSAPQHLHAQTTIFNGVEVPGVVVAHIAASNNYKYNSPTITIMPDGSYVAAHDVTGTNAPNPRPTYVYRSTDQGETWSKISTISGLIWANLFVYQDDLYILGVNNGSLVIRKSTDGGVNWTNPTTATNGLLGVGTAAAQYHTAPMQVVEYDGRLWRGIETRPTSNANAISAGVMSIPLGADLLNASNWTFTNRILSQSNWLAGDAFSSWREGGVVIDPDGNLVNMIRVDLTTGYMPEKAAIMRVQDQNTITFDSANDIVDLPGGSKMFVVRYSEKTDSYWTIASIVDSENYLSFLPPGSIRNKLALLESNDLRNWNVDRIIIKDLSDVFYIGFQYVDWQFDGDDIIALCRTAYPDGLGGALNYHDANFITFHRLEGVVPEPAALILLAPAALAMLKRRR